MHYQDRDRLRLSVLLSLLLFLGLFLLIRYFPWEFPDPFPESRPIIIYELEAFEIPVAKEAPAAQQSETEKNAEPVKETNPASLEAAQARQTPAAAVSKSPPAASSPSPVPRTQPAPRPQATRRASSESASSPATPETAGRPPAQTSALSEDPAPAADPLEPWTAPRTDVPAVDPNYLRKEEKRLLDWISKNAPEVLREPDETSSENKQSEAGPAFDPLALELKKQLDKVQEQLRSIESSPQAPSRSATSAQRAASSPSSPVQVRDLAGNEIGRADLGGRNPRGGLAVDLRPEDFPSAFSSREIQIKAEFIISESGIIDLGSLKISGDPGYTNVTRKIRDALNKWSFEPRPGTVSRGTISFVIRLR